MVAHELRMVIADMQKEDPQTSVSEFEHQFKVKKFLSYLCLVHSSCNVNI